MIEVTRELTNTVGYLFKTHSETTSFPACAENQQKRKWLLKYKLYNSIQSRK